MKKWAVIGSVVLALVALAANGRLWASPLLRVGLDNDAVRVVTIAVQALDGLGERAQAIGRAEAALEIREAIEDPNAGKVRETLAEWRGDGSTGSPRAGEGTAARVEARAPTA